MTTKKKFGAALTAITLLGSLVACGNTSESKDRDIDTGVVTYSRKKTIKVLEDDGETDSYRVNRGIVSMCSVGERWPDCKTKR